MLSEPVVGQPVAEDGLAVDRSASGGRRRWRSDVVRPGAVRLGHACSPMLVSPWKKVGLARREVDLAAVGNAPFDQLEPNRAPGAFTLKRAESVRSPTQCGCIHVLAWSSRR